MPPEDTVIWPPEEEQREKGPAVFELTHQPRHGEQDSHYGVTKLEDKLFVRV
jgi:hypothetical protein